MLQQTQAARVAAAYPAFLRRFPTVRALAAATRGEVIAAWSGLGYNRRALALAEAARAIVARHAGRVPRDVADLRALPGVGPYTAAAVASIAYGEPIPAIDVNLRRVVARARLGADDAAASANDIAEAAARWIDRRDPGAWNQALMDVGREHCRAVPRCGGCPLRRRCRFVRAGAPLAERRARPAPFEGSTRQARGAVLRAVAGGARTIGALRGATALPARRLLPAIRSLDRDGLLRAGPAALRGASSGRVHPAP